MAGFLDGATQCHFCAGVHDVVSGLPPHQQPCPRVKRIEFYESGFPSAVEFWPTFGDRWDQHIVFPRQLVEEEEAEDAEEA